MKFALFGDTALVHNRSMDDDPVAGTARTPEAQQAYSEAVERERRLEVWLKGMLAGGPTSAEATKQWRRAFPIYDGSGETTAEDKEGLPDGSTKPAEDTLLKICSRIRERRELTGKPPLEISGEERERRSAQMIQALQRDGADGCEPTPLRLVLAARYVEGEISFEEYRIAVLRV